MAVAWVMKSVIGAKFTILIALVQLVYAVVNVLNKLAAQHQMNLRILVAYRMTFAAAATVPPSLVFEIRFSTSKPQRLCTERDTSQWRLGWDVRLFAVAFSGIFASGLATVVVAWCVQLKGTLFVSVFSPLTFVFVAIAGSLLLDEKLHLGSIIGFIIIVGGLLVLIWGKSKETTEVLTTAETRLDHSANIKEAIEMAKANTPPLAIIITLQP